MRRNPGEAQRPTKTGVRGQSPRLHSPLGSSPACPKVEHGAWTHEKQRDEVLRLAVSQRVACVVEVAGDYPSSVVVPETAPPALGSQKGLLEKARTLCVVCWELLRRFCFSAMTA